MHKNYLSNALLACVALLPLNASAAIINIDYLNIGSIDLTITSSGIAIPYSESHVPPLFYNMGEYQGDLIANSFSIPFIGTINYVLESTGAYGAAPSTGTADTSLGSIDLDFSDWHITVTGGLSGDFDSWGDTSTIDSNSYNSDNGAFVYAWSDSTVIDNSLGGTTSLNYFIRLTGNASVVPVPAAFWLFGSGLLGLIGIARRNKA